MISAFDTRSVRPQERQAFWQDVVCATFVPLDCRIGTDMDFSGQLRALDLSTFSVVDVQASPQRVRRDRQCIAHSAEEFVLVSLAHQGRSQVVQDGREAHLEAGDFAVYDTRQPYELNFSGAFHQTVLQIPHRAVRERIGDVERLTALPLSRQTPVARLAFDYLAGLHRWTTGSPPPRECGWHSRGWTCWPWRWTSAARSRRPVSSRRNALRYRIKHHVRSHLADSELSLASVAN